MCREKDGLTPQQLADNVNVSRRTIYQLEQNKYQPSLLLAFKIANVFNLPIEEIFRLDE